MNKTNNFFKTATLIFTTISMALIFPSCQDQVFYNIMKDVAEEDATMNGNIISIARYNVGGKEFLATAANGGLRYKLADNNDHGAWNTYSSLPFELHYYSYYDASDHTGQRILKVLADDTNLYLVTVSETKNMTLGISIPAAYHIYTKAMSLSAENNSKWDESTEGWLDLTLSEDNKRSDGGNLLQFFKNKNYYYTSFNVFGTNSVQNAHRRVFIRSGKGEEETVPYDFEYFELDGTTVTKLTQEQISAADKRKELGITDGGILIDSSKTELKSTVIDSAAYLGDKIYFFNSIAVADNETATEASTGIFYGLCADSIYIYGKQNLDYLYYFNGTINKRLLSAGEPISCFAVCNDALIIGRADYTYLSTYSSTGGVVKIALTNREPKIPEDGKSVEKSSFSTNADSQLSSAYEIFTLLNTNPETNEIDSSLYATIGYMGTGASSAVSAKNVGMWSYYKDRGNWNRE